MDSKRLEAYLHITSWYPIAFLQYVALENIDRLQFDQMLE